MLHLQHAVIIFYYHFTEGRVMCYIILHAVITDKVHVWYLIKSINVTAERLNMRRRGSYETKTTKTTSSLLPSRAPFSACTYTPQMFSSKKSRR